MIVKKCDSCSMVIQNIDGCNLASRREPKQEFAGLTTLDFNLGKYEFRAEINITRVVKETALKKHFCLQCVTWGFTRAVLALARKCDLDTSKLRY